MPMTPPASSVSSTPHRTIGLALIGCGIVGSGVVRVLTEQEGLIESRAGVRFEIRHVVVRDLAKARELPEGIKIHSDANLAISDPKVDIVIELIGGTTAAANVVTTALSLGKPVVTANKALLAAKGPELFALARSKGTGIGFEASTAGGIPIINSLMGGLIGNRIDALVGIVNGTCNFILTQMTQLGQSYPDALKEAQKLGFAEADPTMDVAGRDAAQKLALLACLAFDTRITEDEIHIQGIDTLSADDIRYAGELGYVIKLLAIAERSKDKLSLRVAPTLVSKSNVLAEVSGSFNAVSVYGSAVGHALFYGRGAGSLPTASAVVSDIVQVALGVPQLAQKVMPVLLDRSTIGILPGEDVSARYYLRLTAKDQPGVLAAITQALGQEQISIASFLQHESKDTQGVPLVITTHHAKEGAVKRAIARINTLPQILSPTVSLRLLDVPREFNN